MRWFVAMGVGAGSSVMAGPCRRRPLRCAGGISLVGTLVVCVLLGAGAGSARADSLSFSAPYGLDRSGGSQPLSSVSCPSASQCTTVDSQGQQVTFNPVSAVIFSDTPVDPGQPLESVSCPSAAQCTTVDFGGNEVTFDPSSGVVDAAGVKPVDPGQIPRSVSCPSASRCITVDDSGNEVTFDPASGTVNAAGVKAVDPAQTSPRCRARRPRSAPRLTSEAAR